MQKLTKINSSLKVTDKHVDPSINLATTNNVLITIFELLSRIEDNRGSSFELGSDLFLVLKWVFKELSQLHEYILLSIQGLCSVYLI